MAVYTQVHTDDLSAVLKRFGLGALRSFRGIAEGVENSNYLVESDQARFILTLYERRVDPGDLPFFLGLMEHLAQRGIACPLPLKDANGLSLFELNERPAAMITYLDGVSIERPNTDYCWQLGTKLAQLHGAQTGFDLQRANTLSIDGWRALAADTRNAADGVSLGLSRVIDTEIAALANAWPGVQSLPQGVIHADLFPDNVFFLKDTLSGIIDFYFACNDALAYDVAICINAWCFDENADFVSKNAGALIAGYGSVRPLLTAEKTLLPTLCRGAAMRFLLTRLYDWLNPAPGALVQPKDPQDYLKRLTHFQQHGLAL